MLIALTAVLILAALAFIIIVGPKGKRTLRSRAGPVAEGHRDDDTD